MRRGLLAAFLLLVTVVASHALWLPAAVERLAPWASGRLLPYRIELGEVEHARAGRLAVRGLRLEPLDANEPLRLLRAERVDLRYSLAELLRGEFLLALRSLELEDGELDLDLQPREGAEQAPPGEPLELPAELPHLDLADLDLRLQLAEDQQLRAHVDRLATPEPDLVELAVADFELDQPAEPIACERFELRARYAERVFTDLALATDGEPLLAGSRVDLRRAGEGVVAVRLDARIGGGEVVVDGSLGPEAIRAEVEARGVQLAPFFARLPLAPPPLDARVDLTAGLALPAGAELLAGRASVSLRATSLLAAELDLDAVELEAELDARHLSVARLAVTDGSNELLLAEGAVDLGGVELDAIDPLALLQRARARISARIDDPAHLVTVPSGPLLTVIADTRADLEARLADGRLELEAGRVDSPVGELELERGFVQLDPAGPPTLDVDWRFDLEDVAAAAALFGLEGFAGRLAGSVEARGTWPLVRGATALNGADLVVAGRPLGELALVARYDDGRVDVPTLRAESLAHTLVASGAFDRDAQAVEQGRLELQARDLSALLPELVQSGAARVTLEVEGPLAELRTSARVEAEQLRAAGLPPLEVDLVATGLGRGVDVEALQVGAGELALQAAGFFELGPELAPELVRVDALSLASPQGVLLALVEPTTVELPPKELRIWPLALEGPLGRVRAEVQRSGETLSARLEVDELTPRPHLDAFLPPALGVSALDARVRAELTGDALTLSTEGAVRGLATPALAPAADIVWDLALRERRLDLRALHATAGDALELDLFGELPLDPFGDELLPEGPLTLRGQLTVDELSTLQAEASALPRVHGGLLLDLDLGGRTERVEGELELASQRLGLELEGAGAFDLGQLGARIGFGDEVVLEELSLVDPPDAPGVELHVDGTLGRPLDLRELARDFAGWSEVTPLDLEARLDVPSLERLLPLLARLGLADLPVRDGRLAAKVDLGGTLAEPERTGLVELREGVFRLGGDLPTAALVDADITLRGDELEITSGSGELGGAPFALSGKLDLGAKPMGVRVTLSGDDLLLYRTRGIKVRADADLSIEGPLEALLVSGDLTLADSRYARNFEVDLTRRGTPSSGARGLSFFRLSEPPLSTMRFDLRIAAREPFRIATTTVSGAVRPDLRLIGTGEVPVVTGAIYVDPTTVSLPGSSLKIESGTIQFREEDPFMPRLALRGGTRLRGYDITLVVQGTLAEPEILLSSNPPLPDDELLLLVTTGQVPVEGEAASASDTARILAVYLAKDFLARWLSTESTDSEESLINRFEVVAGQDVSRSGADTIWVSFRVTEDLVSTRDKLFLTAERDLFDQFNYGVRIVFRFP